MPFISFLFGCFFTSFFAVNDVGMPCPYPFLSELIKTKDICILLSVPINQLVNQTYCLIMTLSCTELRALRRDVVLLIDGSDSSRSGFPAMRDFTQRIAENLDIAKDKDRIAVVQFSGDTKVHFYLRSHPTKDAVSRIIRTLRHRGGRERNTGAAFQYILDKVFTTQAGSRHHEGVKQVLIVLSGGPSSDSFIQQALSVHSRDIFIFFIGVNLVSPLSTELSNAYTFPIIDFGVLADILVDVLFALKHVTVAGKLTRLLHDIFLNELVC